MQKDQWDMLEVPLKEPRPFLNLAVTSEVVTRLKGSSFPFSKSTHGIRFLL